MVIEVTGMGWRLLHPPPAGAGSPPWGVAASGGAGVEHHEGASTRGFGRLGAPPVKCCERFFESRPIGRACSPGRGHLDQAAVGLCGLAVLRRRRVAVAPPG